MPSRGTLLASAVVLTVPGCLDSLGAGGETATPTTNGTVAGDRSEVPSSRGPVRGESDAGIVVREVEDDEAVEYLPDEEAIRYVAGHRYAEPPHEREDDEPPEKEPIYETTPAERWAETQCLHAAAQAAAEHANDRLDTDKVAGGTTSAAGDRDGSSEGHNRAHGDPDRAAAVSIMTILDRDGDVVSKPTVGFETLVEATPRTVAATYELDENFEYSLDAAVYARHSVIQQA